MGKLMVLKPVQNQSIRHEVIPALLRMEACADAIEWLIGRMREFRGDSWRDAWSACPRADWLEWLLYKAICMAEDDDAARWYGMMRAEAMDNRALDGPPSYYNEEFSVERAEAEIVGRPGRSWWSNMAVGFVDTEDEKTKNNADLVRAYFPAPPFLTIPDYRRPNYNEAPEDQDWRF